MNQETELLLHDQTRKSIQRQIDRPAHALLILGPVGSGKSTSAREIAAGILKISAESLETYPYFISVEKIKKEIGIDSVREVIKKLNLKTTGKGDVKRIVLIDEAQTMSDEAQNSLLKVLEETNKDTVFILTAPYEKNLLPTISSRTQKILIRPVSLENSLKYYAGKYADADIKSAWQLSQGGAGLMDALLSGNTSHPIKQAIDDAKSYIRKNKYDRFLYLQSISKDKTNLAVFLEALSKTISALNDAYIQKNNEAQAKRLLKSRRLLYELIDSLNQNASPKLVCLKLSTELAV
jgi:DNA polymerase III delta prime subunit